MKPSNIFIIRHAESIANIDKSIYEIIPDWKIPLTSNGKQQAIESGYSILDNLSKKDYNLFGIYLSPYLRCIETWNGIHQILIANKNQIEFIRQDPRIREQERGNIRDRKTNGWVDVWQERKEQGPFFYRFPNGESGADLYDRCTGFLDTLHRDFEKTDFPENIIIITHSFTLRVLLMRWFHWSVDYFHSLDDPENAEIFHLKLNGNNKYSLIKSF